MRHAGLLRVGGLTLSTLVLAANVAAAAGRTLEGRWVGGFELRGGTVAVDVTIVGGEVLTGTISLPQRAESGIPLRNVSQHGSSMSFEIPGRQDNMLFDGRFDTPTRVRGQVRQGFAAAGFELVKLAALSREDLRGIYGTYEWAPGKVMLVAPGQENPVYVDYDSGRTGMLYAISRDEFVAGPTMATGFPVAMRLRLTRDGSDTVSRVTVERRGRRLQADRREFYKEVPVRYASGVASIAGSLLLPATAGPHPAIVMIHGSGSVTRDALRPFADHFARNGVAVLITDKRGSGLSTGNGARATFEDLAADALAGVQWLKARADIQAAAIGLQGVSLGGWVAPLAAVSSPDVAFVVVESAPVMTPREHERLRVQTQMRADGQPADAVAQAVAFMDRKFEVSRTGDDWDGLVEAMEQGAREGWLAYVNPPSSLESLRWHWDHIFSYDPLPVLRRLTVPMLVLYGELDSIVPPKVHKARMEQTLREAGRHDVTIREFARANHGFFEAITGGRQEQARLGNFVAGYFEARTDWVRARSQEAMSAAEDLQE